MDFTSYDRITDQVMYLANGVTLNFVVRLSYKDRFQERKSYHSEWAKQSDYRNYSDPSLSIKRTLKYSFAIYLKDGIYSAFNIRVCDIIPIVTLIENGVLPWFYDGPSRVFDIKDNKLVINKEYEPMVYFQSEYNYIKFEPIVILNKDDTYKEGVTCTLNNKDAQFDMSIDTLYEFLYVLKNTDAHTLASTMANYVKTAPYGVNIGSRSVGLGSGGGNIDNNMDDEYSQNESAITTDSATNFLNKVKKKE